MSADFPSIVPAFIRLVPPHHAAETHRRPQCYRPLVIGPAILYRPDQEADRWAVDVTADGRLLPLVPRSPQALRQAVAARRAAGMQCRIATALICPADVSRPPCAEAAGPRRGTTLRSEFYGWSLMYQPAGVGDRAFVDRHDSFSDLPACFELPLELLDRIAFLEARGMRTRPIALITRPEDFEPVAGTWRNRFRPETRFSRPCRLDRLL